MAKPVEPVEPDPAEIWKSDFQCQWYKSADGDVSDQQSLKDGASIGATVEETSADVEGTSTVSTPAATATGASVTELEESSSPSAGSPTPSLEGPTACGRRLLAAPNLTLLLLLVVGNL